MDGATALPEVVLESRKTAPEATVDPVLTNPRRWIVVRQKIAVRRPD
jgi:hypothetical protein